MQKLKNNEPRPKFTGSYKKKRLFCVRRTNQNSRNSIGLRSVRLFSLQGQRSNENSPTMEPGEGYLRNFQVNTWFFAFQFFVIAKIGLRCAS